MLTAPAVSITERGDDENVLYLSQMPKQGSMQYRRRR